MEELKKRIKNQIEYYLSDENLEPLYFLMIYFLNLTMVILYIKL